jgi:1-aminocyclopropane-1-carboxylate deaminase/D-cysteine desulfhydrase-like pyridoxal-dependent ACC family enzyme
MNDHTGDGGLIEATVARPEVTVVAIPCVGDGEYLLQQMKALDAASCGSSGVYPSILSSSPQRGSSSSSLKRRFGQLYDDHLYLWRRIVDQAAIEFDLIYTPRAMELLLLDAVGEEVLRAALPPKEGTDDGDDDICRALQHYEKGYNIIYYHCGGVEGNPTQLNRYSTAQGLFACSIDMQWHSFLSSFL